MDRIKTCGELLVELLEYYGVDTVFGIPGVHTVELYRGLPNTNIQHITPRHEQGAGFMADGYARASGKIGVCFIITGPGMTNILTAMAQAAADSIPMLVISSVNEVSATGSGEGHLHELEDQQGLVKHVAVSKTVWTPESLPKVLAESFAVFSGARPKPVHLQIPIDVITAEANHIQLPTKAYQPISRPYPDSHLLQQASELILQANKPVILYGGGCVDVDDTAQQLAELIDAPTCITINAKGLLPPAHPLSLGSNQSLSAVREFIKTADVVIAIGTELGETDYDVVFDGGFDIQGKLIRVDCDARQLHRPFVADIAILGDAQMAISRLYELLEASVSTPINRNAAATVASLNQSTINELPDAYLGANAVLQCIRDTLDDVIIVGDSTQPVYAGNHGFEAKTTRRWFNSSTGYGTLGYALPAAIGAKIGAKVAARLGAKTGAKIGAKNKDDLPVVCVTGDGGIQFTLAELICAAELALPLIILIWNNQGYGEIRRYMQERGLPEIGVNIKTPNFDLLAQGFGAKYRDIRSQAQLIEALTVDTNATQPVIYEIDESAEFLQDMAKQFKWFQ